jgi:diadenosine tetraphosphate (Ap4A) HIT family hydrolase
MSEQETCFACRKHQGIEFVPGGPVYEDEIVFSGHSWSSEDQATPYLGGFIVEPKRHLPTWAELNDEEAETIGKVIRDVSRALKKIVNAEHIYVFVLGHHVPHLHVWVVPRYPDTPREYWGLDVFEWPDRPVGGQEEVEDICKKVRSLLG